MPQPRHVSGIGKRASEHSLDKDAIALGRQTPFTSASAIEAEVAAFIKKHSPLTTEDGKAAVVRNGYLPKRPIQTGLGDLEVHVPKVRDRSGTGIKFNSSLVPPHLKRTKTIEEFLPWLYLRGISTGDFSETLKHLLGPDAPGLSSATISRLKQD